MGEEDDGEVEKDVDVSVPPPASSDEEAADPSEEVAEFVVSPPVTEVVPSSLT